jgi:hypothetical protein
LFCFPQTLATRKINDYTLAQKRTAMTNTERERESNSSANKTKNILIGICLLASAYFWGGLTVHKQIFPFEQMVMIKSMLLSKPTARNGFEEVNTQNPDRRTQYLSFTPKADVVMFGDSITQCGVWEDIFPTINIRNRGIGWDKTNDLILRIDSIFALNPQKIFLMVGTNDFSYGHSIEEVMRNYKIISQKIQEKNIELIIQSTLECSKRSCGKKLEKIRELNRNLKIFAQEKNIRFVDINVGLTTEQEGLLEEFTYDGIHLLGSGYAVWGKNITPYIKSN